MKKYIFISLLIVTSSFSQKKALSNAADKFNQERYIDAINVYEQLVKKGDSSVAVLKHLADANYFNANYEKASVWYQKVYQLDSNCSSEYLYRYGQSLKSADNPKIAIAILELYAKKANSENRSKLFIKYNGVANTDDKLTNAFKIVNLRVNSTKSDYGANYKGDTLIFASARSRNVADTKYQRTQQSFTNLYYTIVKTSEILQEPKLFSVNTYSKFHEATPTFSKDGKTMYFTQNELKINDKGEAVNGLYKIYKSVFKNEKWDASVKAAISVNDTSRVAHPAFSADEKYLYFASDMFGTLGESDIFKAKINEDGSYGKPENLGSKINTEGRESYPFITSDNKLLFASDGHPGYGGFDIFVLDLDNPNALPINLGSTINSPMDDFAMVWNREKKTGLFTSNRKGGKGDDDIYLFEEVVPFVFETDLTIKGTLQDIVSKNYLQGAQVVLLDNIGNVISTTKTDDKGFYSFEPIKSNLTYSIRIEKEGYDMQQKTISVTKYETEINVPFVVSALKVKFEIGTDIAKLIKINQIYFDVSKYFIREDAKIELDKIVVFLNTNTEVKIEIGSHTDCRQSSIANQILSQKRAAATLNYLVEKGINKDRLTAKGYGESKLVNKCADGVKCTEAEHQQNRRSTFIILE